MNLKVKDNLFILGSRVISYETEVACIEGDAIVVDGKYSRTTTKQIVALSSMAGLRLVQRSPSKKMVFYQFEYGVKCKPVCTSETVSVSGTRLILEKLREAGSLEAAAAAVFFELPKKDQLLVESELGRKGWNEQQLSALKELMTAVKSFGLA